MLRGLSVEHRKNSMYAHLLTAVSERLLHRCWKLYVVQFWLWWAKMRQEWGKKVSFSYRSHVVRSLEIYNCHFIEVAVPPGQDYQPPKSDELHLKCNCTDDNYVCAPNGSCICAPGFYGSYSDHVIMFAQSWDDSALSLSSSTFQERIAWLYSTLLLTLLIADSSRLACRTLSELPSFSRF